MFLAAKINSHSKPLAKASTLCSAVSHAEGARKQAVERSTGMLHAFFSTNSITATAVVIENVLAPAVSLPAAEHGRVAQAATTFEDQLVASGLVDKGVATELHTYVADLNVTKVNRQRQELLVRARDILMSSNKNVVAVDHGTERGALFDAEKLVAEGFRQLGMDARAIVRLKTLIILRGCFDFLQL